ncbi:MULTISPECIES: hypothetical protein [unclassified Streptococcus]|nr:MULTISPECIES: hypothetical protein [unclassified Streptococcus]MCQ9212416.1 hypothetical protein [Streptococcus sp. B01]MCQ9213754.1 hypothetical protein [Streptococcus sp. O1]
MIFISFRAFWRELFFFLTCFLLYALYQTIGFVAFSGLVITLLAAALSPTLGAFVFIFFALYILGGSGIITGILTGVFLIPVGVVILCIGSIVVGLIERSKAEKDSFGRRKLIKRKL